jgi:hypothetical protein
MRAEAMQQQRKCQPTAGAGRVRFHTMRSRRRDLMTVHVPVPSVDMLHGNYLPQPSQMLRSLPSDASIAPLNALAGISQPRARHVSNTALSFTAHPTPSP